MNDLLGIHPEEGTIIDTYVEISDPYLYQSIVSSNIPKTIRKNFGDHLHTRPQAYDLYQEILTHTYGERKDQSELSQGFLDYLESVMPVRMRVIAGNQFPITTDIVIGPNAAPYVINVDTLSFNGGSLSIYATTLTINAKSLEIHTSETNKSKNAYHIGIFGLDGENGEKGADGVPYNSPAKSGSNASVPSPGICTGASKGGNGDNGFNGTFGKNGTKGEDSHPNLPANIFIGEMNDAFTSNFVIETRSGAGGNGGQGGTGGVGQNGGNGGRGCEAGCECTPGGDGGNGGTGGTGGDGGTGGNGTDGNPISITFPSTKKDYLKTVKESAQFGAGGAAGNGGKGGIGGIGGTTGKKCKNGANGGTGQFGNNGKQGAEGNHVGAPGNFIFNYHS